MTAYERAIDAARAVRDLRARIKELEAGVARLEGALREILNGPLGDGSASRWANIARGVARFALLETTGETEPCIGQECLGCTFCLPKQCICGAPNAQPCGPNCKYPYRDRSGKGPFLLPAEPVEQPRGE